MEKRFHWFGKLEDGTEVGGSELLQEGKIQISRKLPKGTLQRVEGYCEILISEEGRVFLNGYQSWSLCYEYSKKDKMKGTDQIPKLVRNMFAFDRYSDYHFQEYPAVKGVFHGYSYGYFREGDTYTLIASLNETLGYTVLDYDAETGILKISRDCEGLECDGETELFGLYIAVGTEDEVFDGWFDAMQLKPRTTEKLCGYSSWYNRYQKISDETITSDLSGAGKILREGDLFQIDDGWEPFVGDWLEPDSVKFPKGMRATADAIHEKGYKAGLWLAPFVAEQKSKLYTEHPNWFLKINGEPWKDGSNWSGFYSLDIDQPAVLEYVEQVFRKVFDEWNYDLVKLDFLYAAAPFGTNKESRAGRMMRAMKLLRKWCGDKLILGCGVPLMPAFGLVDYCRVSCDVTLDWDDKFYMRGFHRERPSTKHAILTDTARRQLNGRAFGNDPDVFFLRTENTKLSPEQKQRLLDTCTKYGSVFLTSDDMGTYTDEMSAMYEQARKIFEKI